MAFDITNTPASRIKSYTYLDAIEKDRECDEYTKEGREIIYFGRLLRSLFMMVFLMGLLI
jgi:hypothetical protein